jgi:hypothetical protein
MLLFLVQILVPLYRYNTRLATFYNARADAITIIEHRPGEQLESLVSVLSPESIDFGIRGIGASTQQNDAVNRSGEVGRL